MLKLGPEHLRTLVNGFSHHPASFQDTNPLQQPAAPAFTTATDDRGARFDKLDKEKAGKLSRDYYTTHQFDPAAAGERFTKWDTDKDGFVSRDEYVEQGK